MPRFIKYMFCWCIVISTQCFAQSPFAGTPLENTPFDPDTWPNPTVGTPLENTPFDPQTHIETVDDLLNLGGTGCEMLARQLRDKYPNQRSETLSKIEKYYLRPYFGSLVDAVKIQYEAEIPGNPTAMTLGRRIYMSDKRLPDDAAYKPLQLIILAHELHHVKQYIRNGSSIQKYCRKYMNQWSQTGDYDAIRMEHEAFEADFRYAGWLARKLRSENADHDETFGYKSPSKYIQRSPITIRKHLLDPFGAVIIDVGEVTAYQVRVTNQFSEPIRGSVVFLADQNKWTTAEAELKPGESKVLGVTEFPKVFYLFACGQPDGNTIYWPRQPPAGLKVKILGYMEDSKLRDGRLRIAGNSVAFEYDDYKGAGTYFAPGGRFDYSGKQPLILW